MEYTALQQQIALSILKTTSNKTLRSILDTTPDLTDFFAGNFSVNMKDERLKFVSKKNRSEALLLAERYIHWVVKNNTEILFYQNENFPQRLLECHDTPITLFKQGNFDLNKSKVVAIVGTRNITNYGKLICENLIQSFKNQNIIVVSGLAYGVDVYAHELCLKNNIPTVGVLGHGFQFMYPAAHRNIAKAIQENGGLISEFLPDTRADKIHFPMRNRIIAGLADATIVIESGAKGGSLITAEMANGYNREVFAFPGSVFDEYSKGCNQLIKQNKAILINSGEEFLDMMSWNTKTIKSKANQVSIFDVSVNLVGQEKELYTYIKKLKEVQKDELLVHFQHYNSELFGVLLQLEMNGLIASTPAGGYRCV